MHGDRPTYTLAHDCHGAVIPSGMPILLTEGMHVTVTQHLGGQITVMMGGQLIRIAENDASAVFGEDYEPAPALTMPEDASLQDWAWATLATCYDPEISVDIVALGLIYGCDVSSAPEGSRIRVTMTLTAPGCGMGPLMIEDIKRKLMALSGVVDVQVELVFDPPWHQGLMSEEAKLELGLL